MNLYIYVYRISVYGKISIVGLCLNFHIHERMISYMILFIIYVCAFMSLLSEKISVIDTASIISKLLLIISQEINLQ